MTYYLSEIYSQLPSDEKRRIQKKSGTILSENHNPEKLRQIIQHSLQTSTSLSDLLAHHDIPVIEEMLLENAGIVNSKDVDTAIFESLKSFPHFIFPDKNTCFLSGEALELHVQTTNTTNKKPLFESLIRLSPRERSAYCRWMKVEKNKSCSGKYQSTALYRKLLATKSQHIQCPTFDKPLYLDDIWANNPSTTQMAWFFRDILPFYQCLREEEERIQQLPHEHNKMEFVNAFKYGKLVIVQQPQQYNQEIRYRVYPTFEKVNNSSNHEFYQFQMHKEQGVLFS